VIFVVATVIVLIAATYAADKATRQKSTMQAGSGGSEEAKSIGIAAPDVTLKTLDGKSVTLADYKGKVVLVNFWATWCDPCRIEIPELIEIQQKYADKGFTILGVAMDEEGASVVSPFVAKERFDVEGKQLPMSYPILLGDDKVADKFGGLLGYPTTVLISRDGKEVKRITGIVTYDEITKAIESHL
jgi:thiol-disulfide isomerase/thioredoxin